MQIPPLTISPEQLVVYKEIQKIGMAWFALRAAIVLFSVTSVAFLCALFVSLFVSNSQPIATGILGGLDAILGFALRQVYAHLFPTPR